MFGNNFYTLRSDCQIKDLNQIFLDYFGERSDGFFVEVGGFDEDSVLVQKVGKRSSKEVLSKTIKGDVFFTGNKGFFASPSSINIKRTS